MILASWWTALVGGGGGGGSALLRPLCSGAALCSGSAALCCCCCCCCCWGPSIHSRLWPLFSSARWSLNQRTMSVRPSPVWTSSWLYSSGDGHWVRLNTWRREVWGGGAGGGGVSGSVRHCCLIIWSECTLWFLESILDPVVFTGTTTITTTLTLEGKSGSLGSTRHYTGTSLSSVRQRPVMGPGLVEAERTGGRGEEEEEGDAEEAARTGGDAEDADRTGGGCGEDATSTGGEEEEEEEEQRIGGRGSGTPDAPLTCGPTPSPSPPPLPASSFFFFFSFSARGPTRGTAPRLSRAFSMLSRSARRSENQQSTSVWDSLVSRDSWSVGRSGRGQRCAFVCVRLCVWWSIDFYSRHLPIIWLFRKDIFFTPEYPGLISKSIFFSSYLL